MNPTDFARLAQNNPELAELNPDLFAGGAKHRVGDSAAVLTEHNEQVALFAWAEENLDNIPVLGLLYAIPNGGYRHPATAGRMKAEGQRAGVPDICLPVPRGKWHGLYIELKVGRNKPTDAQSAWLTALSNKGIAATCVTEPVRRGV